MVMAINALMPNEGADLYYSPAFRRMIESHMLWLRNHPANTTLVIDPHDGYKYEGDLMGLLQKQRIQPEYHWVIMRMNDMTSFTSFRSDRLSLIVPAMEVIEQLRGVFQTTYKKTI